jgi:hypothetical protein
LESLTVPRSVRIGHGTIHEPGTGDSWSAIYSAIRSIHTHELPVQAPARWQDSVNSLGLPDEVSVNCAGDDAGVRYAFGMETHKMLAVDCQ